MERKSIQICGSMAFLVVLVLAAQDVKAGAVYYCGGGCFNECLLQNGKSSEERLPCYWSCLRTCVPRSPTFTQYYCQLGCSLETCIPTSSDGAGVGRCLDTCTSACKP